MTPIETMLDRISMIQYHIQQYSQKIHKIDERITLFYDPRSVPLDLDEAKRLNQEQILVLESELTELLNYYELVEKQVQEAIAIKVPVVTVSMTHSQALEIKEEAYSTSLNGSSFSEFLTAFEQHKQLYRNYYKKDWTAHYQVDQDSWMPHTSPDQTIRDITLKLAQRLNQERQNKTPGATLVLPSFCSDRFFHKDANIRHVVLQEFRESGGVFIIDPISLFHQEVFNRVLQSQLFSDRRVAVLVLSPMNTSIMLVNTLLETAVNSRLEMFFSRFAKEYDRLCEFGGGSLVDLHRWIFTILSDAEKMVKQKKIYPGNDSRFRQLIGQADEAPQSKNWPHIPQAYR